jgi:hypothetical protein
MGSSHRVSVKVHDLTDGMHAGIGSTGATDSDRMVCHFGQSLFDCCLNRSVVVSLDLPSTKGRTVVLDTQGDTHHAKGRRMAPPE